MNDCLLLNISQNHFVTKYVLISSVEKVSRMPDSRLQDENVIALKIKLTSQNLNFSN